MKFLFNLIFILSAVHADNIKDIYWNLFDAHKYEQSYKLLVSEEQKNNIWAEGRLGELFYSCIPDYKIICDKEKGIDLIRSAASKGDIRAQSKIAEYYWKIYQNNQINQSNLVKSLEWYSIAATNPNSNFTEISAIATLYYYTPEIKDLTIAFKWYLYGAEKGIKEFQKQVSQMYLKGEGVKKNNLKSKIWLNKSKRRTK